MKREELIAECAKVRKGLELAAKHNLNRDEMFYLFPKGCCGSASEVLACWLPRQGEDDWYEYVHGWRNDESHAWLEYKGLIIDITADQFPEITEKVIVTTDRSFYDQFEEDLRYVIPKNSSIYSINVLLDFLRRSI